MYLMTVLASTRNLLENTGVVEGIMEIVREIGKVRRRD